jgi:signal peptidase II
MDPLLAGSSHWTGARFRWLSPPLLRASLVVVCVFGLDQLSKSSVAGSVPPGAHRQLMSGIELVNIPNREFIMGVFPVGQALRATLGMLGLLIAAAAFSKSLVHQPNGRLWWMPVGLMLGGGLGNMFDLLSRGEAIDFIEFVPARLAFNLADAAVFAGSATMALLTMLDYLGATRGSFQAAESERPGLSILGGGRRG